MPFHPVELSFCGFAAVHSDAYSSHVRLPTAETTIIIIPGRDFRNFIFASSRVALASERTRPKKPPRPRSTRNAHNYEHVTRLISCLNSLLHLDRPISDFDAAAAPIDARSTPLSPPVLRFDSLFWDNVSVRAGKKRKIPPSTRTREFSIFFFSPPSSTARIRRIITGREEGLGERKVDGNFR